MSKSESDVSRVVRAVQERYFELVDAEIAHLREIRFQMGDVEDRSYDYKMMINSLYRAKDLFHQVRAGSIWQKIKAIDRKECPGLHRMFGHLRGVNMCA